MRYYFKNHMPCKSTGSMDAEEISKERYDTLLESISTFDKNSPIGKYYQLQFDGTWKLIDLPKIEETPDILDRLEAVENKTQELTNRLEAEWEADTNAEAGK